MILADYLCSVLALVDFSFEFAGRYLYKNANWHIKPNEKIGLVGLNGTGKSTLLRVISGDFDLREGKMSKPGDLKIGFLNQDLLSLDIGESVRDVVLGGRDDLMKLDKEINELLIKLETQYDDRTLQRLSDCQEQFGALGGYDWHAQADKILEGLGFSTEQLGKSLREFSGGWRMRAMLAKLLLMSPDLLLLDEPTNHLDLPTIQWLEDYLYEYQGTYVIVSHDRFFLDRTVNRIAEVAHQQLFHYKGNFTEYLEQKEERDEMMQRRFENQQDFIRQQMRFIQRFRYKASKSTAVQSRVKMLEKMDKIEVLKDEKREFDIKFNIRITPGKTVVEIKDVKKAYGDNVIFSGTEAQLLRGDKVALVGANGKGKSTLLRLIYGGEPFDGDIQLGWNVEPAFFAQHQLEALDLKNDLLNEIGRVSGEYTERELRTVLGCFLFTGEEVFKKVKVLSGGEKSRLALAKTLITQSNFLLLDEPTNHLDMFSTSVLAESLIDYAGTVLFVSHDRTFISRVANKIWWIENGQIREYQGTYDEYQEWVQKRIVIEPVASKSGGSVISENKSSNVGAAANVGNKAGISKNQIKKLEDELAAMEDSINGLKSEKAKVEAELHLPEIAADFEKVAALTAVYDGLEKQVLDFQQKHDLLFEEWLMLQEG